MPVYSLWVRVPAGNRIPWVWEELSRCGWMAKLGDQFEVKYGYESDTSVEGDVSKLSNQIYF